MIEANRPICASEDEMKPPDIKMDLRFSSKASP